MNGSHISVFMMSVALAYSAPRKKCITRRQGSYTDNSGRVVINNNKNTNNNGNNNNRNPNSQTAVTNHPRKRCCPYDFDSETCHFVNDRKVCGYNMNNGGPEENPVEQTFNVGNGCWFRRGRFECGYKEGPFKGIRRPPVYDGKAETITTDQESDDDNDKTDQKSDDQNDARVEKLVKHKRKTTQALPNCVQIRRKIVCSTL